MDKEAVSNRCLWDVTEMPAGSHWDLSRATEVRDPYEGSVQGLQLVGPHPRSMDLVSPSGADFKRYATGWEERYSVLIRDRRKSLTLFPVVSPTSFFSYKLPRPSRVTLSMFPVIGHYGTVEVRNIIVPNKFETTARGPDRRKALERLLDQNIKAYVEQGYPAFGNWQPFALPHNRGPNFFTVLTDPEGRILAIIDAFGSEPGLESEDPISDLLMVVELLALAKAGTRAVFGIISRRAARKAAQKLLPRLTRTTEEQISALAKEHPGLTTVNAERALRGPDGAVATLSGAERSGARELKAADIEFRRRTSDGVVVLRREVKGWTGNQSAFNETVGKSADQLVSGGGGEILVQVPSGTNARSVVQRFKGTGGLSREQQAARLGRYRSMKLTIVDESGGVLLDEPLEFPPLRTN